MKLCSAMIVLLMVTAVAHARLGETEAQMIARFGEPVHRAQHSTYAQGKVWHMGPSLSFRQDDWSIGCDLVDGRCVKIQYRKSGEWTEEQVQLVLAYNSQGAKWTETSKPETKKYQRTWKRVDGAEAGWSGAGSMNFIVPAYERAKKVIEAKAKAAASQKPKI
jgi:hypothetical protein